MADPTSPIKESNRAVTGGIGVFAVVSGIGWVIDVSLAVVLVHTGLSPYLASFAGAAVAVSFVYFVSQILVFEGVAARNKAHFLAYVLWQIFAIALASLIVAILAQWLFQYNIMRLFALTNVGLDPLAFATGVAKALVTPLTLIANFVFMKWLKRSDRPGVSPGRKRP